MKCTDKDVNKFTMAIIAVSFTVISILAAILYVLFTISNAAGIVSVIILVSAIVCDILFTKDEEIPEPLQKVD